MPLEPPKGTDPEHGAATKQAAHIAAKISAYAQRRFPGAVIFCAVGVPVGAEDEQGCGDVAVVPVTNLGFEDVRGFVEHAIGIIEKPSEHQQKARVDRDGDLTLVEKH